MTVSASIPGETQGAAQLDVATARRIFAYVDTKDTEAVAGMVLRMARAGELEMLKIMCDADLLRSASPSSSALALAAVPLLYSVGDTQETREFLDRWMRKFASMVSHDSLPLSTLCAFTKEEDVARGMLLLGARPNMASGSQGKRVTSLGRAFTDANEPAFFAMLEHLVRLDEVPMLGDGQSLFAGMLGRGVGANRERITRKILDHWHQSGLSETYALRIGKSLFSITRPSNKQGREMGIEKDMLGLLLLAKMENTEDWVTLLQQGKTKQSFLTELVSNSDADLRERVILHLVSQGVDIDVPLAKVPTGSGNATKPCTMLMRAVWENNAKLTDWLLEQGADPNFSVKLGDNVHTVATIPVANEKAQAIVKSWQAKNAILKTVAAARQHAPSA